MAITNNSLQPSTKLDSESSTVDTEYNLVDFAQNDFIACVILDRARNCLLLHSYRTSGKRGSTTTTVVTTTVEPAAFWFPYTKCQENESTNEAASRLLDSFDFVGGQLPKIVQVIRIHSSHLLPVREVNANARVVYLLCEAASTAASDGAVQQLGASLAWMNLAQMRHAQRRYQLLGLEPIQILKRVDDRKLFSQADLSFFFHEPRMGYVEAASSATPVEQLVASAKFTRHVQDQLFAVFLSHAFPSDYLNLDRFRLFIDKVFKQSGQSIGDRLKNYFYAFDIQQKQMLSFTDILLGKVLLFAYFILC